MVTPARGALAAVACGWGLAACSGSTPELEVPNIEVSIGVDGPDPWAARAVPSAAPATSAAPSAASTAAGTAAPAGSADAFFACRLPAPVTSDDACSQDSDCAPAVPCHARACVARAKAQPPKADTVCTRQLVCDSIDVNRCGCHEGRCSLVPPTR